MYRDIPQWLSIRKRIITDGESIRKVSRDTNICRKTILRILSYDLPPPFPERPARNSKLKCYEPSIIKLIAENQYRPIAMRHSIKDIYNSVKRDGYQGSYSAVRKLVGNQNPTCNNVWENAYNVIANLSRADGIKFLQILSENKPSLLSEKQTIEIFEKAGWISGRKRQAHSRVLSRDESFEWMRYLLQRSILDKDVRSQFKGLDGADILLRRIHEGRLSDRNRSIAILSHKKGIAKSVIAEFLFIKPDTVTEWIRSYDENGIDLIFDRARKSTRKYENATYTDAVFKLLHQPPSSHGVNRTSWKMSDLSRVLREQGQPISIGVIRKITKNAGYRWIKARTVLTSNDPKFRDKLDNIHRTLSNISSDEAFFSIDEFGPFSIKMRPGRSLVAQGEHPTVPQTQKSRGTVILIAALELSGNQISHFYCEKKNTLEIIKMVGVLTEAYCSRKKIYLSWDAASWHSSKGLIEYISEHNAKIAASGRPFIEVAELPSGSQFLNVIESVFSGLSRAIIHNSDYADVSAAKTAIDLYFSKRNEHFLSHPKRAGAKIWGKERVPAAFSEASNCKDPRYR